MLILYVQKSCSYTAVLESQQFCGYGLEMNSYLSGTKNNHITNCPLIVLTSVYE